MIRDELQRALAARSADDTVIDDGERTLSAAQLDACTAALARQLDEAGVTRVALYADNGSDWIVADLACRLADVLLVPLPLFFSAGQCAHVLERSGCDALLTDRPDSVASLADGARRVRRERRLDGLALYSLSAARKPALPPGTRKLTFTSGTTGTPKGVCLSAPQQLEVARELATVVGLQAPRHLCVLPLSTLLENLAGVYAPLLAGGTLVVPPLAQLGVGGSSSVDVMRLAAALSRYAPHSVILVPELLTALVAATEQGWTAPRSLRFVAVGGGKVATGLLVRARAAGLPAYEGYGLSECASVIALNVPDADRPGAAGQPLPHVTINIEDGEIVVGGSTFLGYLDDPDSWGAASVRTGDLGWIDASGYVHISGRRKNLMITSFGRNLSPEWVESELLAGPVLRQAVVLGDARPHCVALLAPASDAISDARIDEWVARVNGRLPDYARVARWRRLDGPCSSGNGLATDNGRPRRSAIERHYASEIARLYSTQSEVTT